jgi:hypothetical protein
MRTKILVPFLLLIFISACKDTVNTFEMNKSNNPVNQDNPTKPNEPRLQVIFKNASKYFMQDILVGKKLVGDLPKDSSSKPIAYKYLIFDTGLPVIDASVMINGKTLTNHYRYHWYGTQMVSVDSGKFFIDIEIIWDSIIYLSCKNPTRRWIKYSCI